MTPQQVRAWGAEMRVVHRRLRDAIELAREAIEEEGAPHAAATDPLLYCWGFCAALSGHHRGEDTALLPRLVREHPELEPVVADLVRDHHMIEHLLGALQRAADAPTAEKLRHLDGIEAVMETHFRYEEKKLVEVLDAMTDEGVASEELYGPLG